MSYLGAVIRLDNKYCIRYSRSLYGFPLRKGTKLQIRTSTSEWKNGILRYNQEGVNCSVLEGLIVRTEEII